MNAAVVKRTQEALGKVIRRPPLTEKLLNKPPFRYLHDIITELSSDDAVKRVLAGEKVDTKGRISLTSKSQEWDNKNAREEPKVHKDKEDRRNSEINERSTSRDRKQKEELKEEGKPREKERDKEKTKENDRDRHKDAERDKHREGERERTKARTKPERDRDRDRGNRDRDKDGDRERERKNEGGREKERWRDRERERERDKGRDRDKDKDRRRVRNEEPSRDPDREKSREHDKPEKKSSSSREVSKKLTDGSFKDSKAETETDISTRVSKTVTTKTSKRRSQNSVEGTKEANTNSASVSDDNSTSLWRDSIEPEPAVKQKGDSPSDAEGEVGPSGQDKSEVSENPEVPNEPSSSLRRMPRPGSARPAPPRVKRQESVEVLTTDRTGSGKTVSNVIIDSQNSDNEEDDQFVVEAAPQLSEMSELEMVQAVEVEEDEKHGGLVKKILETKKDYEKLQQPPKPGEKEKLLVFESAWKKEKDVVSKEIEKLRASIQTLCKSALPLGKIMDYIQEDVDAMQNELQLWHSENKQHAEALQKEQSVTDCAVEPLKAELAELEQLIRDQQDKICAVKAAILRNEEKIQRMVRSVTLSSRR
ncbi:TRAF3-interacting protein 1 isoform X5 [Equus asinus]|uniref:TRAF3-interacting protein 1 isoform X5 n=1 Tax=Equus asinus TaxID=9793 RepID=UPI0038F7D851